jgi:hypothetical protein
MGATQLSHAPTTLLGVEVWSEVHSAYYQRPLPELSGYDQLLGDRGDAVREPMAPLEPILIASQEVP